MAKAPGPGDDQDDAEAATVPPTPAHARPGSATMPAQVAAGTGAARPGSATMPAQVAAGTGAARPGSATMPAQTAATSLADVIEDVSTRLREVDPGNYVRLGELARGGLGRIVRARDERTGRIVAIKEVLHDGGGIALRLVREALITAHLQHPTIVPVYEAGRWPHGEPFYAMKLVRGRSLEDRVAETRTTAERLGLLSHVIDVADALAYAHAERVIHRDLKPANVLLGDFGETVVIDWGLAKNLRTGEEAAPAPTSRLAAGAGETVMGSVMGTPAYMPPEQARGETVDERADVYAIGALTYHLLSGQRPYAGLGGADAVLDAVQQGPPEGLQGLAADVPPELVAIVERAMATRKDDRYATARELAEDLRRFETGQLVGAHRYTVGQRITRFVRRHRAAVTTAAIALACLAGFGAYSVVRIARERDEARVQRHEAERQRGLAEGARVEAERRLGELQLEGGRQALLAGDAGRALAFLTEAVKSGPEAGVVPRVLAARALGAYASTVAVAPGHEGTTFAVALTPDGRHVISAGSDETLRAWDVGAAREAWAVPGPIFLRLTPDGAHAIGLATGGGLTCVRVADGVVTGRAALADAGEDAYVLAVSPDGTRVAVGGVGGTVGLWALPALTPIVRTPRAHATRVRDLAFGPDGAVLASGSDDGQLVFSDGRTGARTGALPAHAGGVTRLVFGSASGAAAGMLVTAGADGVALVWDVATRRPRRRFVHGDTLYDVAIAPDGARIATSATSPTVIVWDLATNARAFTLGGHGKGVPHVRFMPDGRGLATTDEDGQVWLYDARTGARWQRPPLDGAIVAADVSGSDVLVVGGGGSTRAWRVEPAPWSAPLPGHTGRVRAALALPDGGLVSASDDGTLRRWAPAPRAASPLASPGFASAGVSTPVPGVGVTALASDGTLLVSGHDDGSVRLWSLPGLDPVRTIPAHTARVRTIQIAGPLLFTASEDGTARTFDLASGAPRLVIDAGGPLLTARLAAGGTRIATLRMDRVVAIWDATTGARADGGDLPPSRGADLGLSPDGSTIALGEAHQVDLFDVATAKLLRSLPQPMTVAVTWSSDGKTVATTDAVGDLWLFDPATAGPLRSARVDSVIATFARFRPGDGALVAVVGRDRVVGLYETATARLLGELPPLAADVVVLEFTPDGRRLLVGTLDGTLHALDVAPWVGAPDALARLAACVAPWQLEGGTAVVHRPLVLSGCPRP